MTAISINPLGSMPSNTVQPAASSEETHQSQLGWLQRQRVRFLGEPKAVLKEDKVHVHWLSILYMVFMSVFALQVFALQDFQTLFSGIVDFGIKSQSFLLVIAVVGAVIVSDYAAPKARELAKLSRLRGEDGAALMLWIYALMVYATDGYAAITVLYRSSMHLPADTPPPSIGPVSGAWLEVGIRGMLIVFTGWMIHTVTQKQYPTSNTLARRGAETTGGVLIQRITEKDAREMTTGQLAKRFRAFTQAMNKRSGFRFPWQADPAVVEAKQWTELENVLSEESTTQTQQLTTAIVEMTQLKDMIAEMHNALMFAMQNGIATASNKSGNHRNAFSQSGPTVSSVADGTISEVALKNGTGERLCKDLGIPLATRPKGKNGAWVSQEYAHLFVEVGSISSEVIEAIVTKLAAEDGITNKKTPICRVAKLISALAEKGTLIASVQDWLTYQNEAAQSKNKIEDD